MYGYFAEIDLFKSIDDNWVTMKYGTAFMIFICVLAMWFENSQQFISGVLITTCAYYTSSYFLGFHVGFFPIFDEADAVQTIREGMPCWFTLVCFSLFAIYLLHPNKVLMYAVLSISFVAFCGYLLEKPQLYYDVDWSTSMALHTAIALMHLSVYRKNETI